MEKFAERFWAKVELTKSGCWIWMGYKGKDGYGQLRWEGVRGVPAHVYSYELVVGPVPNGLVLDHLCNIPPCVRPAHLEPVTQRENVRRGEIVTSPYCRNGHLRSEGNTYLRIDKDGREYRGCRACRQERERRRRPPRLG